MPRRQTRHAPAPSWITGDGLDPPESHQTAVPPANDQRTNDSLWGWERGPQKHGGFGPNPNPRDPPSHCVSWLAINQKPSRACVTQRVGPLQYNARLKRLTKHLNVHP